MSHKQKVKAAIIDILGHRLDGKDLFLAVEDIMDLFEFKTLYVEDIYPNDVLNNPEYRRGIRDDIKRSVAQYASPHMDIAVTSAQSLDFYADRTAVRAELQLINFVQEMNSDERKKSDY